MGCREGRVGQQCGGRWENFGKKFSRVNKTRYNKDKAEELLAGPFPKPIESHVYRLGLFRSHRRSRKTDGTFRCV
jgi:hypothetical protein